MGWLSAGRLGLVSAVALAALVITPHRGDPSRASAATQQVTATVVIPLGRATTGYSPSSVGSRRAAY